MMKPSVVCFCCGAKRDKTQNEKRDTLWLWCSAFSEAAHVFFSVVPLCVGNRERPYCNMKPNGQLNVPALHLELWGQILQIWHSKRACFMVRCGSKQDIYVYVYMDSAMNDDYACSMKLKQV